MIGAHDIARDSVMGIVIPMKPTVEGSGPGRREQRDVGVGVVGRRHTGVRVLSRATCHTGYDSLQPGYFGLVRTGRGGLQGDLAVWSPALSLVGTGVGHTGSVRGRCISRLLLLGAVVVGAGPRLAVRCAEPASGQLWPHPKTVKRDHLG